MNLNKMGQLIFTLSRTFYEASVANEVDRRRCRGRGDSTEDDTVVENMATYAITLCKKVALVTGVDRLW
jgi:hypothetical protein